MSHTIYASCIKTKMLDDIDLHTKNLGISTLTNDKAKKKKKQLVYKIFWKPDKISPMQFLTGWKKSPIILRKKMDKISHLSSLRKIHFFLYVEIHV